VLNTTIERTPSGTFRVWCDEWLLREYGTLEQALQLQEDCRRPEAYLDYTTDDIDIFSPSGSNANPYPPTN
jgi:hypothetical protein